LGPVELRLPPQLRRRHGRDGGQGNQGSRAGDGVPERRPLAKDVARINDAARGKWLSVMGMALAVARNYDPFQAPTHFKLSDMLKKFDKTFGATGKNYGKVGKDRTMDDIEKRRKDRWNFLFIAGMWFQDLFNYDFRRTEQCIIPYATQEGEILLRLQHGRGLAQHHREDAHDGDAHQVVRRARPARDLRRRQEGFRLQSRILS
jgi:hypothetical protein